MFNINKKIVDKLKADNERLKADNERLQKIIDGENICTKYCQSCKHAISISYPDFLYSNSVSYYCKLQAPCKNFEDKDE